MKLRKLFSIALVLALALTSAIFTAGAESEAELVGNTYRTGDRIVKDPETIRVVVERHPMDKSKSFADKEIVKQIEETTGIHFDWVEVPSSDIDQKIPLLIASDMPDVFLGGDTLSKANFVKNLECFVSLEPYMEEGWLPNTMSDYARASEIVGFDIVDEFLRQTDGNIYSLLGAGLTSVDSSVTGVQFINTRWLENVGMEMPADIDAFYEVLKAFKEKDANGDGDPNDEIPLEFCNNFWAGNIWNMFGYWGFTAPYTVENGKVVPTANSEDFRAALEFYSKLAREGLLDVEGFSQTRAQFESKVKQGKVGVALFWSPTEFISDDSAMDYVFMPPFQGTGYEGKPIVRGRQNMITAKSSLFITTECKNPTAVLRLWDYLASSPVMKNQYSLGLIKSDDNPTGIFEERDGALYHVTEGDYSADFTWENAKYTYQINNYSPLILPDETTKTAVDPSSPASIRTIASEAAFEYLPVEGLPYRNVSAEKSQEFALKTTDLNTFIENFIATSIVDGIDDDIWEAYVSELESYNYSYYIEYYQGYLDGDF